VKKRKEKKEKKRKRKKALNVVSYMVAWINYA
jgi:hypothetical protein